MVAKVKEGTVVPIRDIDGNVLGEWNDEMINTIRETVAPDATLTELALFGLTSKKAGLDPFLKEMYFVKYDKNKAGSIMTSYKGLLKTARNNPEYKSLDGMEVYENDTFKMYSKDGKVFVEHETNPLSDRGDIVGAWATAVKKDGEVTTIYVKFDEYKQMVKDKRTGEMRLSKFWAEKPATMIKKVAKSHAIREAFGDYGMYTMEEMPNEFNLAQIANTNEPKKLKRMKQSEPKNVQDADFKQKESEKEEPQIKDVTPPESELDIEQEQTISKHKIGNEAINRLIQKKETIKKESLVNEVQNMLGEQLISSDESAEARKIIMKA